MASVTVNGVELTDTMTPTERFNAISRSLGGKVIDTTKQRDPYMENWSKRQSGATATELFLAMNEQRIAQGLSPLGADGTPVSEKKAPAQPEVSTEMDAFFQDAQPVKVR
jgi:hypothetical protein